MADGCQRQREAHDGTVARRALHGDGAAMSVEDGPGDGQAQPATLAGAIGIPAAVEALKDVRRLLGRDAGPLVVDLHHGALSGTAEARAHRAAARRELDGVAHDVAEGLLEPRRVVRYKQRIGVEDKPDAPGR